MNNVPAPVDPDFVALNPEQLRALAGLHDLQLQAVSLVALQPLSLLLIGLLVLVSLGLLVHLWRRQPRQQALRKLRGLRQSCLRAAGASTAATSAAASATASIGAALAELCRLLREVGARPGHPSALVKRGPGKRDGNETLAMAPGLAGEEWLSWLDQRAPAGDRGAWTGNAGQELLRWPYQRPDAIVPADVDPARLAELFALAARWLRANA